MNNAANPMRTSAADEQAGDILACMHEAVIMADLKGIILVWNQGAEDVFGFTAAEAIGQSVDLVIPEKMRAAHWEGFNKAVEHGDTLSVRGARMTRALKKNGEPLYVDMSFAMVHDQAGALTGSIAVARDATARFMAERAARQQAASGRTPDPTGDNAVTLPHSS